jgi:hypothetical protein
MVQEYPFIAKYAGPSAKSARPWLVTAQSARHNQVPALLWTPQQGRAGIAEMVTPDRSVEGRAAGAGVLTWAAWT